MCTRKTLGQRAKLLEKLNLCRFEFHHDRIKKSRAILINTTDYSVTSHLPSMPKGACFGVL